MRIRLSRRRSADARCAFCHGDLDGVVVSCPRCSTTFHRDCRAHLEKCPTLGCETVFTAAPEVERERPLGLWDELVRERVGLVAFMVVLMMLVFGLVDLWPPLQPFVVAGGLLGAGILWAAHAVARDMMSFRAVPALLRGQPRTMPLEVRVEQRGDDRLFVAHLGDVALDLDPVLASPPRWLLALRPGTAVEVFGGPGGPVVIRTGGHTYAVPESRVRRVH